MHGYKMLVNFLVPTHVAVNDFTNYAKRSVESVLRMLGCKVCVLDIERFEEIDSFERERKQNAEE